MKTLTGNNMTTIIPPWAGLGVPCDCDANPSLCHVGIYDSICDYDDTCNTCGLTSSTAVTTTFHGDAGFADNGGDIPDPSGGYEQESAESGMPYYGYRYYNPELGRWVNRDPIGERGGLNLHIFTINTPINRKDPLGLSTADLLQALDDYWTAHAQSCVILAHVGNTKVELKNYGFTHANNSSAEILEQGADLLDSIQALSIIMSIALTGIEPPVLT